MSRRSLVIVPIVGLLLAACTGGDSGGAASSAPASRSPSGSASTRIEVELTDALASGANVNRAEDA